MGFQDNSIYPLHACFSSDIIKWREIYTKTDSWFQKSYEEFGQFQASSGKFKSKKLKFHGLLLSKIYIHSAKILSTEDLSNITFNYLCENSPIDLFHFWSHKSFFSAQLLCVFSALFLAYQSANFHCSR